MTSVVSSCPVCSLQSKGGILSKACDYIQELRQSNARLGEDLENLERLRMDNQLLRQEVLQQLRLFPLKHTITMFKGICLSNVLHRFSNLDHITTSCRGTVDQ